MKQYSEILTNIKNWVNEAGEELLEGLERTIEINEKSSSIDLVTEMDIWAEKFLLGKIGEHYPGHAVVTEEGGTVEVVSGSEYEWIIDPIDGTTNYAHGFPMFCISIGVKHHGETVIGVVYAPGLGELYEAVKGKGSYLNGKPLVVSRRKKLRQAVIATGFPYDRAEHPQNNVNEFSKVVLEVGGIRRTGSAALDLCQVAAGRFEGYWEFKLKPWDVTAGILLVEEAGGRVKVEQQDTGLHVLAGNDTIFIELERLLEA
ncbi:inositol monophosphatase family protein [Bacillus marinisedimentorum]|uniref:inositol monophosphatase family protein n=1 Tax=Bacillus marinisedimentorum TaxID=1821260 RepID=UPI000872F5A3|nr:inositol monophosphatase family protein [Bacillus marinisedimentorum]